MYSQFFIAAQLPKIENALAFQKCLVIGNYLMLLSFCIVVTSIFITFALDEHFTVSAHVSAHIATIIFAGLLKIGYVLRCIALHGFGQRNF